MSRFLLTGFAGLVCGASFWAGFGALAAIAFSKMPGGAREGGGAMAGFFVAGPACGFIGLLLGSWLAWRVLANRERTGSVALGIVVVLAVLLIGITLALQPTNAARNDFPGHKAQFAVKVSFPAADIDRLSKADQIEFQMRSGEGTDTVPVRRDQIRREGDRAIVPAVFGVIAAPRTRLLAVMQNDRQVMCSTLTVDGPVDATTEWSHWQSMEEGLLARWRLIVTPK